MNRATWLAVESVRLGCDHGPDAGRAADNAIRDYARWCADNGTAPNYDANVEAMGRRAAAASLFDAIPLAPAMEASRRAAVEFPYVEG